MSKNPYINALLASLYIIAVSSILFFGQRITGPTEDTVFAPIAMLSLLVLSAATMAFLFFYQPLQRLVAGDVAGAASLSLKTIGAFALITLAFLFTMIFIVPRVQAPLPAGKSVSPESYVSQHISELSPAKEVLGGKFYVTGIEATDGKGTVRYEDGHNAFIADFAYTASDVRGIEITSFTIRD
ncbi:MAG: hypothetical protein AAB790_01610 [Patescibacteria group bacterium]